MRIGRSVAFVLAAYLAAASASAFTLPAPPTEPVRPPETTVAIAKDFFARMTVPVTVNDAGPFAFMVDTGASKTVVSDRLAASLGLPDRPSRMLVSITGPEPVAMAALASIEVGGLRHEDVDAAVLAQEPLGAIGILGIDNLADRQVILDFRRKVMTISGGKGAAADHSHDPPGTIVVTARRREGQLILTDAYFRGHRIDVVLDTGAETSIGNLAFLDLIARRAPNLPITEVTSVTGKTATVKVATLPTVMLDKMNLHDTELVFGDLACFGKFGLLDKPAMLLGMDVLRHFDRVAIDFGKRRVSFSLPRDDSGPSVFLGLT